MNCPPEERNEIRLTVRGEAEATLAAAESESREARDRIAIVVLRDGRRILVNGTYPAFTYQRIIPAALRYGYDKDPDGGNFWVGLTSSQPLCSVLWRDEALMFIRDSIEGEHAAYNAGFEALR